MKSIVLVALAGLATVWGCGKTSHSSGSITFYWSFVGGQYQVYGDGTSASPGCVEAGVDTVVLTVTDPTGERLFSESFDCVESVSGIPGIGVEITDVLSGNYTWVAEGWRGQVQAYSATGGTPVTVGADTGVDVILDALYSDINIGYSVDCIGISRIAVAVYEIDSSGASSYLAYSTDLGPNPTITIPCGSTFTLPSMYSPMSYELHFISALDNNGLAVDQLCSEFVDHTATARQQEDSFPFGDLQPATQACP